MTGNIINLMSLGRRVLARSVYRWRMQERLSFDRSAAEEWITGHVSPTGEITMVHDRPWAVVLRVPTTRGDVWFKACGPVQRFEPYLTRELSSRWAGLVSDLLACDEQRSWMLTADAGTSLGVRGNPPEDWLMILPRYAQLQAGEVTHAQQHLDHGVSDLRVTTLPLRYRDLLAPDLPMDPSDIDRFNALGPRFAGMCRELRHYGIPDSIQHDDLHFFNVYEKDGQLRILDWGDASIGHPFASLFETFRFLEERNGLRPDDPWFARLRDAYLEPWGRDLLDAFDLGMRVGAVAHAIAWARQRSYLPDSEWPRFDVGFKSILRRALNALSSPRHHPV